MVDNDVIVSRVVTAINVPVDLANFGEDALRAEIVATVPSQLTFTRATSFEEVSYLHKLHTSYLYTTKINFLIVPLLEQLSL